MSKLQKLMKQYNRTTPDQESGGSGQKETKLSRILKAHSADVDEGTVWQFITDSGSYQQKRSQTYNDLDWQTGSTSDASLWDNEESKNMTATAKKVRTWAWANKDQLDAEYFTNLTSYVEDFLNYQTQSTIDYRLKTEGIKEYKTQEEYDQAVQEYEQTQEYYDKYSGMTANQLTAKAASLPEGKEKNWVMAYAEQTPKTKEELQQDLIWAQGEYEYLTRTQSDGQKMMELKNQLEVMAPDSPRYAELEKQYEEMLRRYPSMSVFENLDDKLTKAKTAVYNTENALKYYDLSSNKDYEEKSLYAGEGDRTQHLVNNQESAAKWDTAWTVQKYLPIIPGMETASRVKELWGYENLHLMEEAERKNFNYLYNTQGEKAAKEYLDWLQYTLNARSKEKVQTWVAARTRDIPVLSQAYTSLLSTPIALLSGEGILDAMAQKAINTASGKWKPVDYNRDGMMASVASGTVRNTVGADIQSKFGTAAAKAYQLGMGIQDSAAIAGLTIINPALGKMGAMLLGGASATQTMLDAVERGASDEQAIGLGVLSGALEILFEKFELDQLLDGVKFAAKGAGKGALVKTMARQALSEGVGEGATEIANILADCVIMAEKSNWQTNIEKYMTQENMTPEAAKKKAFTDAALQVGEAVAGGLVSGAVSSSAFTGVQSLVDQASYAKTGAGIMDTDGGVETLISVANEAVGVSSEDLRDQLTTQIDKVNQNPTARNVGKLYTTVQTVNDQANTPVAQPNAAVQTGNNQALATGNQASAVGKPENTATNQANTSMNPAEVAASLQGKGIPAQKIDTLAEAIVARVNGQELTQTQREVLRSELGTPAVQRVINELIQKKSNGIDKIHNNVYDDSDFRGGLTNDENTALWNSSGQSEDLFHNNDQLTATEEAPVHQHQNAPAEGIFESDTDVIDNIITDGSHLENGKLKPNVTYKTGEHDYFYTTNEDGLVVNARTDDLQTKTHKGRFKHNSNTYGKKTGDHAGHLIADRFGGSPELDNLVSQAKRVNLSEYKRIENQWNRALRKGKKVTVNIDVHYDQGGRRPSSFDVTYTIDGVRYCKIIDN